MDNLMMDPSAGTGGVAAPTNQMTDQQRRQMLMMALMKQNGGAPGATTSSGAAQGAVAQGVQGALLGAMMRRPQAWGQGPSLPVGNVVGTPQAGA